MVERILNKLNSLPHDKALHAFYGLALYGLLNIFLPCYYVAAFIVALALGKEIYDLLNPDKHTTDPFDALATFAVPVALAITEMWWTI